MDNTDKQERLDQLLIVINELKSKNQPIPSGLQLTVSRLMSDLGLTQCDLDDGCINCGS